jgi:hypothetical protein
MFRFSPSVAGGLAIGTAAAIATIFTFVTPADSVDRSAKTDRLPVNASVSFREKRTAVVEVIGARDAAIINRGDEGRALISTDPLANATAFTKNLFLPEVTLRKTAETEIERVPVEKTRAPSSGSQLQGCESGLSPDISPTVPTTKDRCIV